MLAKADINMSSQSTSLEFQADLNPLAAMAYRSVSEDRIRLLLLSDPPGVTEVPGLRNTRISIHVGPSVQVACRRGGSYHRGRAVHGDIDIIPAGMPSLWEVNATDTFFTLSISPELLSMVAEEFDCDPGRIEIRNRFQVREPQLENLGWALKAEMECGYPCGRLYLDSLAIAVATRLVRCHSSLSREPRKIQGRLSDRRLRRALDYIEANLGQNIALADIAAVVGLSASHFKLLFREAVGLPVHQYLIRRRVERAKSLLSEGKLSISQIACETGFAHQSHLARHMRRLLGVSPKALRELLR